VLTRGFSRWWNTRVTRAGYVAIFVCVFVVVFIVSRLGVPFLAELAIALAAGVALRPVFKRQNWTYVKKN
jgi:small-conductance mechanosensitive channel